MDKDIEVSSDYDLLQDILDDYQITSKQLAFKVGRAYPTVRRYCVGEATIPSIVWRVLYEKTRDLRILKLITGDLPIAVVELPREKMRIDKSTMKKLIDEQRQFLKLEELVLEMIADERIDQGDRRQMEQYNRVFPELIQSLHQTNLAINKEFNEGKKCLTR